MIYEDHLKYVAGSSSVEVDHDVILDGWHEACDVVHCVIDGSRFVDSMRVDALVFRGGVR